MQIFGSIKFAALRSFTFRGRSERLEHWGFVAFSAACVVAIGFLHALGAKVNAFPMNYIVLGVGSWLLIANTALLVRRLHDHDLSGLYLLAPYVSFIALAVMEIHLRLNAPADSVAHFDILRTVLHVSLGLSVVALGSFCARAGDKEENYYGPPA